MPIIVTCPECKTSYNLPDEFRGKKVRCRKCAFEFASAADAPTDHARLTVEPADDQGTADAGIRSDAQRSKVRPSDNKDGGSRARRRWGDDDAPAPQQKSSALKWVLIGGGGFLLLVLLTCGGIGGFVFYQARRAAQNIREEIDAQEQIALEQQKAMQQQAIDQQKQMADLNNPNLPVDPNNPQKNPVNPNPRPGRRSGDYANLDDALGDLKPADSGRARAAADWLAKTNLEPARQAEVGQKLEPFLDDRQVRDHAARALVVWATKENVPALLRALESDSGSVKQAAMDTLAKLKDERAAAPLAKHMANFVDRGNASKALQTLGPVAEKEVVKYAFDADGGTHTEARKVLDGYKTKESVYIAQAIEDLKGNDKARRQNVCTWLEKASVDETLRGDVGKALEPLLIDPEGRTRENAIRAMKTWASKDNVPALINLLSHKDGNLKKQSMEILGGLKDERAVVPIGERLLNVFDRETASHTLQKMGSMVERNEIVDGLNNKDDGVRLEICRILGACGTARSIGPLQKVAKMDKNKEVALAAISAIREIEGRKVK
jgi:HEAT repeat protein